jgi:hypothetical protein
MFGMAKDSIIHMKKAFMAAQLLIRNLQEQTGASRRPSYGSLKRKFLGAAHCYIDGRKEVQNGWDPRQWRLNATAPTLIQSSSVAAEYPKAWDFFAAPFRFLRFVDGPIQSADIVPCTWRIASLFGNYTRQTPGKMTFTVKRS